MREITITGAISRLHFIIISFFLFIISSLILLTLSIYNGFEIEKLQFQGVSIKQLYIKWDEKLVIEADSIDIKEHKQTIKERKHDLSDILFLVKNFYHLSSIIESINLNQITFNDFKGSIHFNQNKDELLKIDSNKLNLIAQMNTNQANSIITINNAEDNSKFFVISGNIIIDNLNETLSSQLNILINNDAQLHLNLYTDKNTLVYAVDSQKKIVNLSKILRFFPIPKDVGPWIYDAMQYSSVDLHTFSGNLVFNKMGDFLKEITIDADVYDLAYKFNPQIDAIKVSKTHLAFENGILHIYPQNAVFDTQKLKNSFLDIDLNPDKYLLTIHLIDDLQLDKNIVHLLSVYHINIPFTQTSSFTNTQLDIAISLMTSSTHVNGVFKVDNADFLYKNVPLHASNAEVSLQRAFLDIKKLNLSYQDNIQSSLKGTIDFATKSGQINIDLTKVNFEEKKFALDPTKKSISLIYNILPTTDTLTLAPSSWIYNKHLVALNSFDILFNYQAQLAQFSKVQLTFDNKIFSNLLGSVHLNDLSANMHFDITKLDYNGAKLAQTTLPFDVMYGNNIELSIPNTTTLKVADKQLTLTPLKANFIDGAIKIEKGSLTLQDTFSCDFEANYNGSLGKGDVTLQEMQVKNSYLEKFFDQNSTYNLTIDNNNNNNTNIYLDEYALEFSLHNDDTWSLNFNDIGKIYKNTPYFSDYNLTNGSLSITTDQQSNAILFSGTIKYPYALLVKDNTPIQEYQIQGSYTKKDTEISVNDALHVSIKNDIQIKADKIGFNIPQLIQFHTDHKQKDDNSTTPKVFLDAQETYLYFKENRQLIADTFKLKYVDSQMTAELRHKKGKAQFNLKKNGIFYLYGSAFDDLFMEKLFATSKFVGGALSFDFDGKYNDFSGIVEIQSTTLKEYKLLNNVFAFINTVPSLMTFKLPDYSKDGLKVNSMYAGFTSKNRVYTLTDIALDSKEIKIYGRGILDLNTENIDLDLNLKTDLGSQMSQIPIVGYILFDKKSVATSLKVTGNMYDPSVNTTIAHDIAVAPLNIIKRTLLLPMELFSSDNK